MRLMKFNLAGLFILAVLLMMTGVVAAGGNWFLTDIGYKVWNNHSQPNESVTWSGGIDAGGYASGLGVLQW